MNRKQLSYFDIPLFVAAFLLAVIGLIAVTSATHDRFGIEIVRKQVIFFVAGVIVAAAAASFNFQFLDRFANSVYVGNLVLLICVFFLASPIRGSKRWLEFGGFSLQPSEFSKIFVILTLASLLARHSTSAHEPKTLLKAFAHVAIPAALVFKQPHLGNTLALFAILFGMLFLVGARVRYLSLAAALGAFVFLMAWKTDRITDEQKRRLISFVRADQENVRGDAWQSIQSKVAIGAGGLMGQGPFRGSQNQLGFVPDNHTDFIYADIGEEYGFVGTTVVLALFAVVLWRILVIISETEILYGAMVASGILIWLTFQICVNLGMTLQLLPVMGLPLPFVSYGGSSMLSSFLAIGVLESIAMRRRKMVF